MRKTIRILLTSVGRRVELVQAFSDAAVRLGVGLEIIGADISDTAPALIYCHRTMITPRISSPDYIPTLLDFCRTERVDALIPTIDTDLLLLAEHRETFRSVGTVVCVATPEKVRLCRDKRLTTDYFHSLGLNAPKAVDDIQKYDGGFPAFIKPIDGSSSIGAHRADSFEQLKAYADGLDHYIVQPFISGTEYTVDIFCDLSGEPIYITPRVRLAVRSGEVLKTKIHHEDSIVEEMRRLVADFKPIGAITVQLIRDAQGVNHYIEINPRFGGGSPLSMRAGADSAQALLKCLLGQSLIYQKNAAAEGAVYSRFDQCVCVSCGESMPVKAVVFDLDDTLYAEKDYVRSGYRAVSMLLPEIPQAEQKLWNAFLKGKPAIDAVLEEAGMEDRKAECLRVYRGHKPEIRLYDGVKSLLEQLRERGVKLGILTDGRPEGQRNKLDVLGLYDLVDTVIITDELGGDQFRKPNDIAFRVMQGRMQVPYGQMLYVGDNRRKDFQAPKQLGMQGICFHNPEGLYVEEKKNGDVSSIAELAQVLLK